MSLELDSPLRVAPRALGPTQEALRPVTIRLNLRFRPAPRAPIDLETLTGTVGHWRLQDAAGASVHQPNWQGSQILGSAANELPAPVSNGNRGLYGAPAIIDDQGGPIAGGETGHYNAFPGLCRAANGTLITIYRRGKTHGTGLNENGVFMISRSTDRGLTWSAPQLLMAPHGSAPVAGPSGLTLNTDCKELGLVTCRDGTIVGTYWQSPDNQGTAFSWSIRSTDNGNSWRAPVFMTMNYGGRLQAAQRAVELPNGDLVCPFYGNDTPTGATYVRLAKSTNQGQSWADMNVEVRTGGSADEPRMTLLPDGRLLMMMRWGQAFANTATYSSDGGETWSPNPSWNNVVTGVQARPELLATPEGDIVMLTATSQVSPTWRHGLYLTSLDDGVTWRRWTAFWNGRPANISGCQYGELAWQGPVGENGALVAVVASERTRGYIPPTSDLYAVRFTAGNNPGTYVDLGTFEAMYF